MSLHATSVAVDGRAVLLRGPSGSGKSDLALRLIDAGALLIADDRTELRRVNEGLLAFFPSHAPEELKGSMEVRGLGIVTVGTTHSAPVALVVDLDPANTISRMPEEATCTYLDVSVPLLLQPAFEASAAAKVRLAARSLLRSVAG